MKLKCVFFLFAILISCSELSSVELIDSSVDTSTLESFWSYSGEGLKKRENERMYYSLHVNGRKFYGARNWHIRWERIKDLMDWKGKRVLDIGCNIGLNLVFLRKYCQAGPCVGVDLPDERKRQYGAPRKLSFKAKALQRAFKTSFKFVQLDLDTTPNYEAILGDDFDVAFLMSVYRWVHDKERLMNYISNIPIVVYEAHNNLTREEHISLFEEAGYDQHILVNPSKINAGRDNRDFFIFYKSEYEHLLGHKESKTS